MNHDIYRQEALDHHSGSNFEVDAILRIPRWVHRTYILVVSGIAATSAFALLAEVPRFESGLGIVQASQRTSITASSPGVVASVELAAGSEVNTGDVILRLRSTDEQAELAALKQQLEAALVRVLFDPNDPFPKQALATLKAEHDLLVARVEERIVRSPTSGKVGALRVRPGQGVVPGDVLTTITGDDREFSIIVIISGQRRAALSEGQDLRLEFVGYQSAPQIVTIERIDDDVMGPEEVRRMLGPDIADAVPLNGSAVVLRARLRGDSFESDGEAHRYFDGMRATVRAKLGTESIFRTLFPKVADWNSRAR